MAKLRIYELAKEFGVDNKTLIQTLNDMGEFVKSSSSTVESPVVRKLREKFKVKQTAGEGATHSSSKAKKNTPKSTVKSTAKEEASSRVSQDQVARKSSASRTPKSSSTMSPSATTFARAKNLPATQAQSHLSKNQSSSGSSISSARHGADLKSSASLAGHRNSSKGVPSPAFNHAGTGHMRGAQSSQSKTGVPRPGNSPFTSHQGMAFPVPSSIPHPYRNAGANAGTGATRGGGRKAHGGRNAWGSASHAKGHGNGLDMSAWKSGAGIPDMESMSSRGGGNGGRGSRWGGGSPTSRPSRGGHGAAGRGSTAGAFGHQGSRSSRARKNRREKTQEYQDLVAPVISGVRIPKGDGSVLRLPQGASLADLAEKIHVDAASLVTVLFNMGEMATATQSLDADTFQLLGDEIGWKIEIVSAEEEDRRLLEQFDINLEEEKLQDDKDLKPRPPVVTVMGHVDHGKTQLLDTIRRSNVLAAESGGITQRIGAYMVTTNLNGQKRKITFLDTPGHEAFTAMRARGAEITDVAILVVAANDGVMPQTVEAINHAQAAGVPIVVAVNKIDLPDANPQKVRAQLMEFGLVAEEFGGDTMFVDISARKKLNIDKLLEAVLLTADADLDLRANPSQPARGATIEARLDKGRGSVATVLVQQGTLHIGDSVVVGTAYGRVRAMLDESGKKMKEATPSTPVAVLGLTSIPSAGDLFIVTADERSARQIAEKRASAQRAAELAKRRKVVTLEGLQEQFKKSEIDMLNLIIKSDSSGSVEALEDELMKIKVADEVGIDVIHRGVGAITQNDVNLAAVDKAIIIGFNVRPNSSVSELAEREGVEIRFYTVIYKAIEDIQAALEGMLKPIYEEKVTSHSEIREIFRSSKFGNIAGSMVLDGTVKRGSKARITRDGIVTVNDLEITSLRRFADDVTEVKAGFEAGINLGTFNDIQIGDIIETYEMQEIERTKDPSRSQNSSKKEKSGDESTHTKGTAESGTVENAGVTKNSASTKKTGSKKSSKHTVKGSEDISEGK